MSEFHFLRPLWFWSLIPALLVWWGLWRSSDPIIAWKRVIDPHLLEHLLVDGWKRRRVRPVHLALVLWIFCVLAQAGPSWEREPSPFAQDQAGLIVLLKAGATMRATDVQPSRMERSKHKLRDLLERREGAASGLIVYSGSAHLVMPLTRDSRIISAMAAELSPDLMPKDGDALSDALKLAANVLDRAGVPGSVLVIADAVSPSQADAVADVVPGLPVQFLSVQPPRASMDAGLQRAAALRNGAAIAMSVDSTDVDGIADRARSDFQAAIAVEEGVRWRDGGYMILPLILLIGLAWTRKGWVVK